MYLIKQSIYSLLLLSFGLLVSCGDDDEAINPETGIIGNWRQVGGEVVIDDLSIKEFFRQYLTDLGLQPTDEFLDELVADSGADDQELVSDDLTFEFRADNTFTLESADDGEESGAWEIRDEMLFFNGSNTPAFTIASLTSSELRLLFEQQTSADELGLEGSDPITLGIIFIFNKQ